MPENNKENATSVDNENITEEQKTTMLKKIQRKRRLLKIAAVAKFTSAVVLGIIIVGVGLLSGLGLFSGGSLFVILLGIAAAHAQGKFLFESGRENMARARKCDNINAKSNIKDLNKAAALVGLNKQLLTTEQDLTKAKESIEKEIAKLKELKTSSNAKDGKDIDVRIKQREADLKNINDALVKIQPSAVSSKTGDQKQDIKEQTNNSQSNTVKIERAAAAVLDNSNVITEARKTFSGKMDRQTLVESNSRARANSVKVKSGENSGLGV